ncbi:molybdopterin-guanine dinucleotide biosynthesis protein B [Salinicoccus siamensis]|uniref:Molybdopterin-guanine dinucleotide biosynthesis protein B n=1 Tax=Salinicoccus siamensis TaxID=381830 RepID=A0ABV5Z1F4_9STAP
MKILQITGFKNTGKTTLILKLVKRLKQQQQKVAVIKHHHLEEEAGSTDTERFLLEGADTTILNTPSITIETRKHPNLAEQLAEFEGAMDVVLIEGYKHEAYPKIVLTYSFSDGHTNVSEIGMRNVLMEADMRYDEAKVFQWFDEWSSGI